MRLCNLLLATSWIWWTTTMITMCGGLESKLMLMRPLNTTTDKHRLRINTVRFTTNGATKKSYTEFIEAVRHELASDEEVHTIPLLRNRNSVSIADRFLLVELSNLAGNTITLAIDATNAFVVAYQAHISYRYRHSYFVRDAPPGSETVLFTNTQQHTLPFTGGYDDVERYAGNREGIELGIPALDEAIYSLYHTDNVGLTARARSFLVSIQMISEAARFRYIEYSVRVRSFRRESEGYVYKNFMPDPAFLRLQNSWSALSFEIQNSNQGVFEHTVYLLLADNYSIWPLDRVTTPLIINLALMLPACRNPVQNHDQNAIIRSVVKGDDICNHPEPTVRIRARDGQCVDVKNGQYNDGNPIQLWPCKSNDDVNQLWTLKTDGTIRSNGKCLTAYGYAAGQYVMIYNCKTAATPATKWEVWDNGTIINPRSSLVLSAMSGDSGTTLTVETNIYALTQGWLTTNNTNPLVTSIVGFMDLCMERYADAVWLGTCDNEKIEQKWAICPDGSIRPHYNENFCLSSNQEQIISILSCSPGSSNQRWAFTNQGTIVNLYTELVMEVKNSDPKLRQIILSPSSGGRNQQWLPLL